jgi:hypothetical protein
MGVGVERVEERGRVAGCVAVHGVVHECVAGLAQDCSDAAAAVVVSHLVLDPVAGGADAQADAVKRVVVDVVVGEAAALPVGEDPSDAELLTIFKLRPLIGRNARLAADPVAAH